MKWRFEPLGEVADSCLGKMLDARKNKGEPKPYLANINVRWGSFDLENLREMRFEEREKERYGLRSGDIVMCEGGEPGRCAIWKDDAPEMMIQKALHRIRPHSFLDSRFLFYYFLKTGRNGGFDGLFTGSTIKHLTGKNLAKLRVPVPPLPIQTRIADILSAYDDLIENNKRRMLLLEEAARQLYREWFVRLRFPGHEHTPITNGLPEGWERKPLGEVVVINERNLPSSFDGEIDYIDISAVEPGSINSTTKYDFKEAPSRARRIVRHGDFIWSCVRPNRKSYAVIWNPSDNLIASTGFAVITPRLVPTSFVEQVTTTSDFVGHLENNAKGAAYPAVLVSDFERAEVVVPDTRLLEAFDEEVRRKFDQCWNLTLQNQKLRSARDLLLPKLMNGEIAV